MEGLLSLLLFAALFYLMMRFGCGAHRIDSGSDAGSEKIDHIDPVCGMHVAQDKGYGKMHQGRLVRFCSKSCLDKFEQDPKRYPPRSGTAGE